MAPARAVNGVSAMAGRKKRRLSTEEAELWAQVAATATPLHPQESQSLPQCEPPALPPSVRRGPPPETSTPAILIPVGAPPPPSRVSLDLAPDPHATLLGAKARMDRRRFEKLRRGRLDPEARLDLHGMTAERAHGALRGFILSAHADGLRLVLVITGKGRLPERDSLLHRPGVLRHQVPHWLAAPPLASKVLQIVPAHLKHGGGGAYYVYLRRQR